MHERGEEAGGGGVRVRRIRGWIALFAVIGMSLTLMGYGISENLKWRKFLREHHCTYQEGSAEWSFIPVTCNEAKCQAVSLANGFYECDRGEWIVR
jgi:hypothetical protein